VRTRRASIWLLPLGALIAVAAFQYTRRAPAKALSPPAALSADDAVRRRLEAPLGKLIARLEASASPGQPRAVRVGRAQVLARVNGTPITGDDLASFTTSSGADQELALPTLSFLLQRAIERELTLQAARAQGVELTQEQKGRVARLRQEGRGGPAQVDFDARDLEGQFLLASLAQKAGVPPPFASAKDVEQYYESHRDQYDELPLAPAARAAAWLRIEIEIRQTLATERQAAYQEKVRELVGELWDAAKISTG
jgi:hypothetical protein